MATLSMNSTPSIRKYTSSFLYQLQAEWDEFMLEISHSTPKDDLDDNCDVLLCTKKSNTKEAFIESLNKFNQASSGNILIPVPLQTLRKLFSPTKPLADDVFKNEFIGEIKENLNLTETACKKLQKLLLNEEFSNEISDFPSPSIPKNFRRSAPARLFCKKKPSKSSRPSFHKNDFLKVVNCFKNDEKCDQENLPDDNRENNIHAKTQRSVPNTENRIVVTTSTASVADTVQNGRKIEVPPSRIISQDYVLRLTPPSSLSPQSAKNVGTRTISQRKEFQSPSISRKSQDKLKNRTVKKKAILSLRAGISQERENQAALRYSDIYDLQLSSSSDSLSLFYAFKHSRKNVKPTIVCTYFNQKELTDIYQIVKKLGHFEIENYVSSKTTHLICGGVNKTINLCKAVARGCWILNRDWIFSSDKENRWLFEERFEKTSSCSAARENRLKRQKYGSQYKCELFLECGTMYVSKKCTQPSYDDIRELILIGSGRLENSMEKADHIIGYTSKRKYIKEIWILNCILRGYVVDMNKYVRSE